MDDTFGNDQDNILIEKIIRTMSRRMNYDKLKHSGNIWIIANPPKKKPAKGGWTHIKRQPVNQFTPEMIQNWMKENPDRLIL